MYRLFIDEFGHDNLNTRNDPKEQFLSLTGVVLDLDSAHINLTNQMDALKVAAFGTRAVVLHRREIIDKKPPPFDVLLDGEVRESFTQGLLKIVSEADYTALTVLIDKKAHFEKYKVWRFQPYHYCLTAMLERYVMFLDGRNGKGDVMAEWRGKKPNMKLENAYIHVFKNGTPDMPWNRFQSRLSSGQLKIQKKEANIAGLQLADLLANPAGRDLICQKRNEQMTQVFGSQVIKILYEEKYHRNWKGIVKGCGTKTLP